MEAPFLTAGGIAAPPSEVPPMGFDSNKPYVRLGPFIIQEVHRQDKTEYNIMKIDHMNRAWPEYTITQSNIASNFMKELMDISLRFYDGKLDRKF